MIKNLAGTAMNVAVQWKRRTRFIWTVNTAEAVTGACSNACLAGHVRGTQLSTRITATLSFVSPAKLQNVCVYAVKDRFPVLPCLWQGRRFVHRVRRIFEYRNAVRSVGRKASGLLQLRRSVSPRKFAIHAGTRQRTARALFAENIVRLREQASTACFASTAPPTKRFAIPVRTAEKPCRAPACRAAEPA